LYIIEKRRLYAFFENNSYGSQRKKEDEKVIKAMNYARELARLNGTRNDT
jgi:hypothetical protein